MKKTIRWALTILVLTLAFTLTAENFGPTQKTTPDRHQDLKQDVKKEYGGETPLKPGFADLPLYFIRNEGQYHGEALFFARTPRYTLWVTRSGLIFDSLNSRSPETSPADSARDVSKLCFIGAHREVQVASLEPQELRVNFFRGSDRRKWTNASTSAAILYRNVYDNIDLKVYGSGKQIEYDWVVREGGDPDDIRFEYEGVRRSFINRDGDIEIHTLGGGILLHKSPRSYQGKKGNGSEEIRGVVSSRFRRMGKNRYGVKLGKYDKASPLVIDPVVLMYSTYFGGSDDDVGLGVAVDSSGMIYVTGSTYSSDFPVLGAAQGSSGGEDDVFVFKLDPSQSGAASLLYSTYLGGLYDDNGNGIAVDDSGVVYITGLTESDNFPVINAYQSVSGGSEEGFVAKLDTTLSGAASLLYSSYLGGAAQESGDGVAVDASGMVYVVGRTESSAFPTVDGFQGSLAGVYDVFLVKLDTTQGVGGLLYSTFFGGTARDIASGIVIDSSGLAHVTGSAESIDFPVTSGAYQGSHEGDQDAFVATFDTTLSGVSSLVYSSLLGGADYDHAQGLTVDDSGIVYVTGHTRSSDFPVLGAYQSQLRGENDAFVSKFDPRRSGATSLLYSTFIGGTANDSGVGIGADGAGLVFLGGETASLDFPVVNGYQANLAGNIDLFALKLDTLQSGAASLLYSTYLGGANQERCFGAAVDHTGMVHLTGRTGSSDYPLQGAYKDSHTGFYYDVFVSRIGEDSFTVSAGVSSGHGSLSPETQTVANGADATIQIIPDAGYVIDTIQDNGILQVIAAPYVIHNVLRNHEVTVTFRADRYTVRAMVPEGNGSVSPEIQAIAQGGDASVTITPNQGYEIESIHDNGVLQPIANPYMIQNVTADHTVSVRFRTARYTVSAGVSGGHGSVSPATQEVEHGDSASITISPDAGYEIASISDNGEARGSSSPYIIQNVTEDHLVSVSLKRKENPPSLVLQGARKTDRAWILTSEYAELNAVIGEAEQHPMIVSRYALFRFSDGSWQQVKTFPGPGSYPHREELKVGKYEKVKYKLSAFSAEGNEVVQALVEL